MDILLIILAGILLVIGLIGCVLPVLPGAPLSYVGILLLQCTDKVQFSTRFLLIWLGLVILVQVLDYVVPAWGTSAFGGSKFGVWGSTIGVLIGLFFAPWGIIIGPFIGAVVGELFAGKEATLALKAGFGSFVGFLLSTIAKLIVCTFLIYYYVAALL